MLDGVFISLNGPDFDPVSQPIPCAPFVGALFRAKIGGSAFFLSNLLENVIIIVVNPHEYKRGAFLPCYACAGTGQRFLYVIHTPTQCRAFPDTQPDTPMQQCDDYCGYPTCIVNVPQQSFE